MDFERESVLITSLFFVALGLVVWWWLWVLRPILDKIESRIGRLDSAVVCLKLNMEGVGKLLDHLRKTVLAEGQSRSSARHNEYCDLVKRHNILIQRHEDLICAIEHLPPVVGERYSTVWDGVTDMFDRMLKAKYEVVES